jgi:hypothetical protein
LCLWLFPNYCLILLIYVLFLVTGLVKTLYVEIYKMYKICKFDIFINLQCFHNALVTIRLRSCQLFVSVFWCYTLNSGHFIFCFGVVNMGSVYKHIICPISSCNYIGEFGLKGYENTPQKIRRIYCTVYMTVHTWHTVLCVCCRAV